MFRPALVNAARRHLHGGDGGFTIQVGDNDPRQRQNRKDIIRSVRGVSRKLSINERVRVRDRTDTVVFRFQRTTNLVFNRIETPGNDRVDEVHSWVFNKFKGVFSLGICDCRKVLGTNIWSQHAYCNAEDFGAGTPGMDPLYAMGHAIVAEAQTGTLKGVVAHVIVGDTEWNPQQGWKHYAGEFHYHVHVDCNPNQTGTPACAR